VATKPLMWAPEPANPKDTRQSAATQYLELPSLNIGNAESTHLKAMRASAATSAACSCTFSHSATSNHAPQTFQTPDDRHSITNTHYQALT
jgi:hypothetical protein